MITTIRLYGALGKKFGKQFRMDIRSPRDAIDAIDMQKPGFRRFIMELDGINFGFGVKVGDRQIREELLDFPAVGRTVTIVPVLRGSASSKAWIQIIAGVALIAIGLFVPGLQGYGVYIAGLGFSLALGGVSSLLMGTPNQTGQDAIKNKSSYVFGNPTNTVGQGECVPTAHGFPFTGSAVVSSGVESVDITEGGGSGQQPPPGGGGGVEPIFHHYAH